MCSHTVSLLNAHILSDIFLLSLPDIQSYEQLFENFFEHHPSDFGGERETKYGFLDACITAEDRDRFNSLLHQALE